MKKKTVKIKTLGEEEKMYKEDKIEEVERRRSARRIETTSTNK